MDKKDLLIEIGTEELPPKALKRLATSFAEEVHEGLGKKDLEHAGYRWFASPRRLALVVDGLVNEQQDREIERRGPALAAAFDEAGKATKAAQGFARSCGVEVENLDRLETDKGSWLAYRATEKGKATTELLEEIINTALARLPIPKRMRWGDGEAEFVRPVHWVCIVFGEDEVNCDVLGLGSARLSYGHRFHSPGAIEISSPADYLGLLESQGKVIADYETRRQRIREQVEQCATSLQGEAIIDDSLLDEVCALVEWPVVIAGDFSSEFLALPDEVLIASMQDHQKYFPLKNSQGKLLNHFITISNIESAAPEEIQKGNERVIYPRLSDAAFFWQRDSARPLSDYQPDLKNIVYQKKLGSLFDKSKRVSALAASMAKQLGTNSEAVERAAMLAKCDLVTSMVGEFPELQGVMGRYYAALAGEPEEVAQAIDEHYKPRFAGDNLPTTTTGQLLALAEKIDTLLGIFAIGQAPTGDKDPFGLRRAAIGLLRILIECELDLKECLEQASKQYEGLVPAAESIDDLFEFIMQRLKRYYLDHGIPNGVFESVYSIAPTRLLDFHRRIEAVHSFSGMAEAESLAAANKRIQNILRQSEEEPDEGIKEELLEDEAEKRLVKDLAEITHKVSPLLEKDNHAEVLTQLACLRDPVDSFFEDVMVMSENKNLKLNRLAILGRINRLFMTTADISKLQV